MAGPDAMSILEDLEETLGLSFREINIWYNEEQIRRKYKMFIGLILMIIAILGVSILVMMFDDTLYECEKLKRENRKLRWMNNEIFALQMKEGA